MVPFPRSLTGLAALGLAACAPALDGDGSDSGFAAEDLDRRPVSHVEASLDTYITDSIQIDWDCAAAGFGAGCDDTDFSSTVTNPGDANLSTGLDPADGGASFDLPASGGAFIDWEDLVGLGNHQGLDLDNAAGRDESSFPRSNSCVGTSTVLAKMDLTYVLAANNLDWAWFGAQRSKNNGDAAYYWVLTKEVPGDARGACRAGERELTFDLSEDDVMMAGHFTGGGATVLRVFTAVGDTSGTLAVNALDFNDTALWAEQSTGFVAAVNTTPTDAGGWGTTGVESRIDADTVEEEIFAEAAVRMDYFTGGGDACDATFYATVITRSSGAGGTSPDLKDVAGPFVLNFSVMEGEASLEAGCDNEVSFAASSGDLTVECLWEFDDGTVVDGPCEGTATLAAGARSATVTLTDAASGCTDVVTTNTVDVVDPLEVDASLVGGCDETLAYGASVTGGSGSYTYAWTFDGGLGGSSSASGTLPTGTQPTGGSAYAASVVVTDASRLACQGADDATATVWSPIAVSLTPDATEATCPALAGGGASDAVTWDAAVTGGTGVFTWDWTPDACDGAVRCTVDPADGALCATEDVQVVIEDAGPCATAASEVETYTKVTLVSATDR